jgi:hypothetical protein
LAAGGGDDSIGDLDQGVETLLGVALGFGQAPERSIQTGKGLVMLADHVG